MARCGPLIDLCRGPHVRHTGRIKALKIYKVLADHGLAALLKRCCHRCSCLSLPTELVHLLGGPRPHGDSAEDLRDLLPTPKDAEGVGALSGGGQKRRPSQDWQSESAWAGMSRSPRVLDQSLVAPRVQAGASHAANADMMQRHAAITETGPKQKPTKLLNKYESCKSQKHTNSKTMATRGTKEQDPRGNLTEFWEGEMVHEALSLINNLR